MSKKEYIEYILYMIDKIDDEHSIKDIYMFVQSCYLSNIED